MVIRDFPEKFYRLITADGIESELKPATENTKNAETILTPVIRQIRFTYDGVDNFMFNHNSSVREYRLERIKTIEVYEYKEIV